MNSLKILNSEITQEMSLKERLKKKTFKVASLIVSQPMHSFNFPSRAPLVIITSDIKVVINFVSDYISQSSPFVMVKKNHHKLFGNDKFEGFCIDLLEKLKNYSSFADYKIEVIQKSNPSNSLRGKLIDKLRTREVDIVIGDFTITQERSSLVDFTIPFMSFGISLLYHKVAAPKFDLFCFLKLFASEFWLHLLVSFILITILMYVMESVTVTLDKGSNYNQIYLSNFAWLALCSMFHQSSNINPR